jgi:hypothetical protein
MSGIDSGSSVWGKLVLPESATVDDFILFIEKAAHRLNPDGLHTVNGGDWNGVWDKFFKGFEDAGQTPTKQQVLDKLAQMLKDFGLE